MPGLVAQARRHRRKSLILPSICRTRPFRYTIAMLKVDISRRHEVAVKMKERNKSDHEITPSFRLNAQGEWVFLPDRAYETDSSFKKGKASFSSLYALYGSIHYIRIRQELKDADV